jgi:hypothetical protein
MFLFISHHFLKLIIRTNRDAEDALQEMDGRILDGRELR